MKRILITGNMGYVGPVVAAHFRRRYPRAALIGYDSGLFATCLADHDFMPETILDTQKFGDIRDIQADVLAGVDAVVHLAAVSNDPMGSRFEQVTHDINCAATLRLAGLAQAAGVRHFVFASSCSVYGAAVGGPRQETDPVSPQTAYARSKIDAEAGLAAMDHGGTRFTCLRFATACGMAPRLRLDLVLNDFVAAALADRRIAVLSDGSPWRPLIDVADMARAIEWAASRDGDPMLVVNAGSESWNYQVRELAGAVAAVMGDVDVQVNAAAQPDTRSYQVDFSLFARLAPDHQPRMSLQDSVRALWAGLSDGAIDLRGFRESRFMRLKMLDRLIRSGRLRETLRWQTGGVAEP